MKHLTIKTKKYENELKEFAENILNAEFIHTTGSVKFTKYNINLLSQTLFHFLMDITECENNIYKHSPKLKALALKSRKSSVFTEEIKNLKEFIKENKTLHLEGYVKFRMADYAGKLDLMTYAIIKKIKFSKGD